MFENVSKKTLLVLLLTLTACGTTKTTPDVIPCPPRPILEGVVLENEQADVVAENYLRLMSYAKKLEARAGCEIKD